MKTLLVFALGLLFSLSSFAQNELKQFDGAKNLEVYFTPLGGSPIAISGIKLRIFNSESTALRGALFVGYASTTDITQQENGDSMELKTTNSSLEVGIQLGYEKHLEGTDHLSPYIGGVVDFGIKTSKESADAQVGDKVVTDDTKNMDGFTRFGLGAVAGFDYYFAKNLYFGGELGFGGEVKMMSDITYDSDREGFKAPDPIKQGSSFNIGPTVISQIRLGWLF